MAVTSTMRDLCRGPGNLTRALGITLSDNLLRSHRRADSRIEDRGLRPGVVASGPRIGIRVGVDRPWRCWIGRVTLVPFGSGRSAGVRIDEAGSPDGPSWACTAVRVLTLNFSRPTKRIDGKNSPAEGVGPPHRAHAADRTDAAVHRPAPDPRGHDTAGLRRAAARGWKVARPDRTFATVDHIVPTRERTRPFLDVMAEDMMSALERNCRDFGVRFAGLDDDRQGIVHVIGPELGLDAAGHDHRVRRQPHLHARRVRRGRVRHRHLAGARRAGVAVPRPRAAEGAPHPRHRPLPAGVYAKDVILTIIQRLGVQRRRRLRLRVRRRHDRAHVDGRADDDLQHVDRGRRARRLRQPRRDDLRPT